MRDQNIAITGASSGLGRALALAAAGPGAMLHLAGRDAPRLGETAQACRAKGAQVTEAIMDVTDALAMEAWLRSCTGLELVIANAGVSAGPGKGNCERAVQVRRVFSTNLDGVLNTVLPAMEMRVPRVAVISSIAGLIALPTSPAYSASKAALDFWVRAAMPGAAREGVALTLVRPGFIRTPLTAKNPYTMPGLMDADKAAEIILAGIARGQKIITFPWWLAAFARLGNLLPAWVFARVPGKPEAG